MKNRKYRHITQPIFNQAKELQKLGVEPGMISQVIKASPATVSKIVKATTFDEYIEITRKYYLTKTKKQAMPALKPAEPAKKELSEYKKQMLEQARMQTEALQEIHQLFVHLTEKKGWFHL